MDGFVLRDGGEVCKDREEEMMNAADKKRMAELRRRAREAMVFGVNTCPASRIIFGLTSELARGKVPEMLINEPEHCAEAMLALCAVVWEMRTKYEGGKLISPPSP